MLYYDYRDVKTYIKVPNISRNGEVLHHSQPNRVKITKKIIIVLDSVDLSLNESVAETCHYKPGLKPQSKLNLVNCRVKGVK